MTDERVPPADNQIPGEPPVVEPSDADTPAAPPDVDAPDHAVPDDLGPRLERLGGEPAPDITPEEFARLQQAGQIHIDPRGRVRTPATPTNIDAGISLRKRRAWYA
ncbi:MAG: hypothetical protein JW966_03670 [Anaerolineae bacterium]|nr:hypothetical protein [Anaerolineae bacterium]